MIPQRHHKMLNNCTLKYLKLQEIDLILKNELSLMAGGTLRCDMLQNQGLLSGEYLRC